MCVLSGDNVGCLLRGIEKNDVERGQVLCKPGSITPHTKFEAEVYVLSKEEGGRHTPFFNGYRPQFYFRTTDVTGDNDTGPTDLATLLTQWGPTFPGNCLDTDGDNNIGPNDLAVLLVAWGPCP